MEIEQARWSAADGWGPRRPGRLGGSAQLVLIFGGSSALKARERVGELSRLYPKALLFGCSTAGEILGTEVHDDTLALTAVHFDKTAV